MMLHLLMYLSINLFLSQATGHIIKIQYICNSLWCSLWDAFELVIELTQGMIKKKMMQKFWDIQRDTEILRKELWLSQFKENEKSFHFRKCTFFIFSV